MSRTSAQLPCAVAKNEAAPHQDAPPRSEEEVLTGTGRVTSAEEVRDVSCYATSKNWLATANLGLVHTVIRHGMGLRDRGTNMDQPRNVLSIDHEYSNRQGSRDGATFRGLSDKLVAVRCGVHGRRHLKKCGRI